MKNPDQIILQLNELLALNNDAERIYLDVMNQVESQDLKNFFRALAFERSEFCRYLGAEIIQKGGEPVYSEHMKRTSSKLRINFKHVMSIKDEYALLDQVRGVMTWSIKKYYKITDNISFPERIFQLVSNQRDCIEKRLNTIIVSDGLRLA